MVGHKTWDRDSIDSVKAVHHDPDFTGPNLSEKAEGNGMKVRFAGNVTGKQVTAVIGMLTVLITAYAGYVTRIAKGVDSLRAPLAQTLGVAIVTPQMETSLATHEVRLNTIEKLIEQRTRHDEKVDDKLDDISAGISELKVAVARLKPARQGGGSQ